MDRLSWLVRTVVIGVASLLAVSAMAQSRDDCLAKYTPQRGQAGKDVIWIPTNDELVTEMLRMARTQPDDLVYDLGAGDGKIAIAAAKQFGARAVGVEYNAQMAQLGQCFAQADGVADKVKIVQGDIFATDFSDATVVTLYLLPDLNLKLRPTLLQMKPGTRVVSHSFIMGDWEPDDRFSNGHGNAYLWIVPAAVNGKWTFRQQDGRDAFQVELQQTFQKLSGAAGDGRNTVEIGATTLRADRLEFAFPRDGRVASVQGRVDGERIEATVTEDGKTTRYLGMRL